eukprot:8649522-Lingulodinium_polyedra.AAC.1
MVTEQIQHMNKLQTNNECGCLCTHVPLILAAQTETLNASPEHCQLRARNADARAHLARLRHQHTHSTGKGPAVHENAKYRNLPTN